MTSFERFAIKNRMLFYNVFTNLIGVWIVILLSFRSISPPFYEIADIAHRINLVYIPMVFLFIIVVQITVERPIRSHLDAIFAGASQMSEDRITARRRLLNAPFLIIGIDLSAWIATAVIYAMLYRTFTVIELAAQRVFFQNALVGLIISTASFFVLEQVLQKSLVPWVFPDGGLAMTPGTARIRIRTRLTALFLAVNLIPFLALLILVQGTYGTRLPPATLLDHVRSSVFTDSLIAIAVGICLTVLVSANFSRPLTAIILVLRRIREGRLEDRVTVTTNDEIGYAGDVINEMTAGLRERERMKQSLALAQEVQLKLLPQRVPRIKGLDIAGTSLYCDETGGDYYDYLHLGQHARESLGVVVGDVSDHGIHSALLMTTARAFMRLRASLPGGIDQIIADVNHHLAIDIEDGGQFMTLFFLHIDLAGRALEWVRAGHDPALWYDPAVDRMVELRGKGIPLGIDDHYPYQVNRKTGLAQGQMIVLGTDGIWEARNRAGEIYGRPRFCDLIRRHAARAAAAIVDAVVEDINAFQKGIKAEDDITLVVVKIESDALSGTPFP
jgi:sigma-B regulation protein RsbU (phosphoserine phosphatase)